MSELDAPSVVKPVRKQLPMQPTDQDALVPDDRPVRGIWSLVDRPDLNE